MSGGAAGVAAIILAAGQGRRFDADARTSKVAAILQGRALVRRAAEAALASRVSEVVVVTGHADDAVAATLEGLVIRAVHNPDYAEGIASSLRVGVGAVAPTCGAVLVLLGDMPRVRPQTLDRLIERFEAEPGLDVVCPQYAGRRGNPVLLSRSLFASVEALRGDEGARRLIAAPGRRLALVEVDDPGILVDVDTRDALARLGEKPV